MRVGYVLADMGQKMRWQRCVGKDEVGEMLAGCGKR